MNQRIRLERKKLARVKERTMRKEKKADNSWVQKVALSQVRFRETKSVVVDNSWVQKVALSQVLAVTAEQTEKIRNTGGKCNRWHHGGLRKWHLVSQAD